jgi:hypothetical protein
VVPAGISIPPHAGGDPRQPEVPLDRALEAQRLLDEVRDEVALGAEEPLEARPFGHDLERRAQEPHGGLLPAENKLAATRTTSVTSGTDPSGNVAAAITTPWCRTTPSSSTSSCCLTSLICGATILPVAVFDVDHVLDLVEREKVTVLPGPPTLYHPVPAR